jgi:nucleotide-binding universal stress UspA family protein
MGGRFVNTIIACIDPSAAARPVLDGARAIAPLFGAQVEAAHVAEADDTNTDTAAYTENVPMRSLHGEIVDELVKLTQDDDVVAAVVGARARPLGRRPAGHVALGLADRAAALVLLVPPDAHVHERVHRVLMAVKGTPENARSLEHAIELTDATDLELVVVHVDDEGSIPSFSDQVQYETDAFIKEFLARYVPAAPEARVELRVGRPADAILDAIDSEQPDLLAIGWRRNAGPEGGVVAREIIARSHVPVLLTSVV